MRKELLKDLWIPILILLIGTIIFRYTNIDIEIERAFYSPGRGWVWRYANPWCFLYRYGTIPGIALASAGTLAFAFSFIYRGLARYRKIGLFLCLVMVLGPGLVVNTTFKHYWGRPRPRQIEIFGGNRKYLPVWEKGVSGQGKSFPSGHASVAFYLFTPFFFLRRDAKKWAIVCLCLGIAYGSLMGATRMVQGGHFASDVLWAGGFTYLTGLMLAYFFRFDRRVC